MASLRLRILRAQEFLSPVPVRATRASADMALRVSSTSGSWTSRYSQHGSDNAWFGACFGDIITGTCDPADNNNGTVVLPAGARNPTWNGAFVETHYVWSPQFTIFQRSEWVRMSQQAIPGTPSNLGDIDNYVFGYRYNPFMTSRAGFAFHNEYSWLRQRGTSPVTSTDLTSNSLMLGFDFDF